MKLQTRLTPVASLVLLSLGSVSLAHADDDFKLSDKLSVTGFIDMSWSYADPDGGDSSQSAGLDQFEMDFLYGFSDKLTAQVDLEYQDNGTGEEVDIEQAFINYAISTEFSIKAGRFLSYSGWETEEPTGLFQYSGTGYAKYFYGGYQQGISGKYSTDSYAFALSVVNSLGDLEGEARDSENPGIEAMVAFMPTESITVKGFYMTDKLDGTDETTKMINLWASYAQDSLVLAAEYNTAENSAFAGSDASGYLLMANYAFESFGLTLRYHAYELEDGAGATIEDMSGITISPSFSVTDNLLMVFEYRMDTDDVSDSDANFLAVEALVTF
jgi:hypothetical protein